MCGIAGYLTNSVSNDVILNDMLDSIYHRGPDDVGKYVKNRFCGGMRRLAINDLEKGGQPLFNKDHSVVVTYNGEIYNYSELRTKLEKKGYVFKTHSDGEVIGYLYDEYKQDLFSYLDGMFAISIWDEKDKKLILARDKPGEKPLYYYKLSDNEIIYASEISSIKKYPDLDLEIDRQAIWDYPTFLWIPEPNTSYTKIKALMPGHYLITDEAGTEIKNFKHDESIIKSFDTNKKIIENIKDTVTHSITSRLLSDVPVGCFLSGGLDSSIVTTIAARELGSLDTFSIGFENIDDPYHGVADESHYAKEYARKLGARHHEIHVTANDFYNDLDTFCRYSDQPFAVSSGLGILSIAREASKNGVKVLLSGDGADECFGGYSWYQHLNSKASDSNSIVQADKIISFQNFGLSESQRLSILNSYNAQERAWGWHYYAHEKEKKALFSNEFNHAMNSSIRFFHSFKEKEWSSKDFISQDREFYFPNEMLRKVDRMTMAYSVESRVPFASPSILALSKKLNYNDMVDNGSLKWSLRQAFREIVPLDIIDRPKHGFNVPIDHWLKGKWNDLFRHTFSTDSELFKLGIIDKNSLTKAEEMLNDSERLNGHTLFCFIMLNKWFEIN